MMYKENLYFLKYINFKSYYMPYGLTITIILERNNYS